MRAVKRSLILSTFFKERSSRKGERGQKKRTKTAQILKLERKYGMKAVELQDETGKLIMVESEVEFKV